MEKIRIFFAATSRDLSMQKFSVKDIIKRMERTEDEVIELPKGFARAVSKILKADNSKKA